MRRRNPAENTMASASNSRIDKIYFVWNADFSLAAAVRAVGEILRGEHSCSLCDVAYNRLTKKSGWKDYCRSLEIPSEELYRNQLTSIQDKAAEGKFPVVLADADERVVVLLRKQEIDSCSGDLDAFKRKLNKALNERAA